jgi:hypothetical protein
LVPVPHEKGCQFLTLWLSRTIDRHSADDCPFLLLHRPHLRGAIQTTPVRASKKKLPTCKPDPVPASLRAVIIYLAPALLQGSSCLPSGVASFRCFGRAALDRRYTWHFSMQGLPAPAVTRRRRGLLPHVFILTLPFAPPPPWAKPPRRDRQEGKGSYFLWHWLWMLSHPPALNRYIALCCPDFPPPVKTKSDDPVGSNDKDRIMRAPCNALPAISIKER